MKVTPVANPSQVQQTQANPDLRAKAIAAFEQANKPQTQETPVADPNNITPEEMSAIRPPTQQEEALDSDKNTEVVAEQTQEPAKPQEQEDPALSRQFAQLARQERQLRAKANQQATELQSAKDALKAREDALKAREEEIKSNYIPKSRFKQDPLSVMEEEGLTYDELTQQAITRQPTDPRVLNHIAKLEAKLAEMEERSNTAQKTWEQQQTDQYNAAVQQIERDVKTLVSSDPEFEATKYNKSEKAVVKLITETFKKDGYVMDVEEAARLVEQELVERTLNSATKIEKIKKQLGQGLATQAPPPKTQAPQQTQKMKTLTNAAGSSRQLSAKDRAILAFKGELK